MRTIRDDAPETILEKCEQKSHLRVELMETAAGATAGAIAGVVAGPIGIATGAILGAAVGAALASEIETAEHEEADYDKDFDDIDRCENGTRRVKAGGCTSLD